MSQKDDLIDSIESQTPDETTDLADDLDKSISKLTDQVEFSDGAGPIPIGPEQGISMLRPMIRTKATDDPAAVIRTLAVIHLETGALLAKHSDTDPADLL